LHGRFWRVLKVDANNNDGNSIGGMSDAPAHVYQTTVNPSRLVSLKLKSMLILEEGTGMAMANLLTGGRRGTTVFSV